MSNFKQPCDEHHAFNSHCSFCIRLNPLPMQQGGLRYDDGKPRVDLLPFDALMELGKVYAYGAKKYTDRNWEQGMKWTRMLGPLLRHLFKFARGQHRDACNEKCGNKEKDFCKVHSRCLHIALVAWNALGLLTYVLRGIGENDLSMRPSKEEGA